MAAYMAQNRIKEIGIRKVLGASVANVTTLLSRDFLKLVMISFCIAAPIVSAIHTGDTGLYTAGSGEAKLPFFQDDIHGLGVMLLRL